MAVTFNELEWLEGGARLRVFIEELIANHSSRRICEIGAGPKPTVTPEMVKKHGLHYAVVDESAREAGMANVAEHSVLDICAKDARIPGERYDMVIAQAVAEHFKDSTNAYTNIFNALAPGGLCISTFSTLYSLPLLLNHLLPDCITDFLLYHFTPRSREHQGKFKAYYSHCRGPVKSQFKFFEGIGYEVLDYRGYFGHDYYQWKLPFLHFLEKKKTQLLLKMPIAYLTSGATVILRRPSCA
jgi:SAM-dependent methyltransferase